jgi:hypothetical protein
MAGALGMGRLRIDWKAGWDEAVLRSAEAKRAVEAVAAQSESAAKALAPVGDGDYRDGISGEVEFREGQWVAVVVGRDFKTNWIERGAVSPTYVTPAQHPLQRGVESTGVKVTPGTGLGA